MLVGKTTQVNSYNSFGSARNISSVDLNAATVPFNRLETSSLDLLLSLSWPFRSNPINRLQSLFALLTSRENVFLSPSRRCAIFRVLTSLPNREVVMPAWICPEVKRAAEAAGKEIIYVDLAKNGINATSAEYAKEARPGRILLVAHVFGVPTDIDEICSIARRQSCVTVEDAVPALGGRLHGQMLGTYGDFGIFGFEESKRFAVFHGGVIVANSTNQNLEAIARLQSEGYQMPYRGLLKAFMHNCATSTFLYGTLARYVLPLRDRLASRKAVNDRNPALQQNSVLRTVPYRRELHPYQAELLLRILGRVEQVSRTIANLADVYENAFRNTAVMPLVPSGCDKGGLMRFPICNPRSGAISDRAPRA